MNENQEFNSDSNQSYWVSVILAAGIFSVASFVIGLLFNYAQFNSEPSGSIISPMVLGGGVICLATSFAGMLAVWHYAKEVDLYLKLGRGALIGFLTGVFVIFFSTVLNELWHFIDPGYTEKMIESTVANFEAMEMPDDTKEMMIDATVESLRDQNMFMTILSGIPVYGITNLITAMIGVKLFGKKMDDEF